MKKKKQQTYKPRTMSSVIYYMPNFSQRFYIILYNS